MKIRLPRPGKERQPGHRPATCTAEQAQGLQVGIIDGVHPGRVEGNFNGATAHVTQGMAQPRQFLLAGIAAGQGPGAVTRVIARRGGAEAKGASVHGLTQQLAHAGNFPCRGRALEGGFPHDVMS